MVATGAQETSADGFQFRAVTPAPPSCDSSPAALPPSFFFLQGLRQRIQTAPACVGVRAPSSAGVGTRGKATIKFAHAREFQPNSGKKHYLFGNIYLKSW